MKYPAQFSFLFLISLFLSGCRTYQAPDCSLRGKCEVDQPDHIVRLNATTARYISYGKNTIGLHFVNEGDWCSANAFTFIFLGKDKQASVDSIQCSYKYASNPSQLLELTYLDKSNAVFCLPTNSPARLEYGRYNLNVEYIFNGQSNSCVFNVNYVHKTETKFVFFWEWLAFMWAEHGGNGP
jgi:hypothetical protein